MHALSLSPSLLTWNIHDHEKYQEVIVVKSHIEQLKEIQFLVLNFFKTAIDCYQFSLKQVLFQSENVYL